MRLDRGKPEPWEVEEQRYEWAAPPGALSGTNTPIGGELPLVVLGLDVGDVQEPVAADREVDERGLDGRLEVDDLPLIDVARVAFEARPFDVQLLEDTVLDDRDAALLGLEHVDQHFFLHAVGFRDLRRVLGVVVR